MRCCALGARADLTKDSSSVRVSTKRWSSLDPESNQRHSDVKRVTNYSQTLCQLSYRELLMPLCSTYVIILYGIFSNSAPHRRKLSREVPQIVKTVTDSQAIKIAWQVGKVEQWTVMHPAPLSPRVGSSEPAGSTYHRQGESPASC